MKKTFIYSICGCFVTGVATATTYWLNIIPNTCTGHTICLTQPTDGSCCSANDTIEKFPVASGSKGGTISLGSRNIAIFDATGTPTTFTNENIRNSLINATSNGSHLSVTKIPADTTLVSVTVNMQGGSLPLGFTGNTMAMEPGDVILSAGVTRADGANLAGFYKSGQSPSTATSIITVDSTPSQTYIAKWECGEGLEMNSKGTCISSNTVYMKSDGTVMDPNEIDIKSGGSNGCTLLTKGKVHLYDYNPTAPDDLKNNMYYYMYRDGPNGSYDNNIIYRPYSDSDHNPYMGTIVTLNNISQVQNYNYLHTGSPNNGVTLYCRSNGCWWSEQGAELPMVVYHTSSQNDCTWCGSDCTMYTYPNNGQTIYYWQCPCIKAYDVPGEGECVPAYLGCTYLPQVTEDGTTEMVCVPQGQYSAAHTEDLVWGLRQPKAIGWTFRGYYLSNTDADLYTTENTNVGAPVNGFGTGNPNNREKVINITSPIAVCGTSGQTAYEITLYGAWAKNCNPSDHATCNMSINGVGASPSSYGTGDVYYSASCQNGYNIESGSGTYNPVCSTDVSGSVDLNYKFINQYGNYIKKNNSMYTVENSCSYGQGYTLLSATSFTNALGTGYSLRYLKIGTGSNGSYFTQNYGLGCSTNVFGADVNSVDVTGYVCDECVPENGTCVDVDYSPSIQYPTSGSAHQTATLWGANTNKGYTACKKLSCAEGYTLRQNEATGHMYCAQECEPGKTFLDGECRTPYEACIYNCQQNQDPSKCGSNLTDFSSYCSTETFVCPPLNAPTGLSITNVAKTNSPKECKYTVDCANGIGTVYEGGQMIHTQDNELHIWTSNTTSDYIHYNDDGSVTVTCTDTDCKQEKLSNLKCLICPAYNGSDTTVTVHNPTRSDKNRTCSYNISCKATVVPRILLKKRARNDSCYVWNETDEPNYCAIDNIDADSTDTFTPTDTVTCTANQCTAGYMSTPYHFLSTEFAKYKCIHTSAFSCPTISGNSGVAVTKRLGTGEQCTYTLSCNNTSQVPYSGGARPSSNSPTAVTISCDGVDGYSNAPCVASYLTSKIQAYICGDTPGSGGSGDSGDSGGTGSDEGDIGSGTSGGTQSN